MIKITTVPTFDAAVEKVLTAWNEAGKPRLVRFEGFDGVGKSGLARLFANRVGGVHVKFDDYITKSDIEQPYREFIRQPEADAATDAATSSGKIVALDAVCLDEIAPSTRWGRGFVVYVKRLSFNNWNPMWHEGLNLDDEQPDHEIRKSVVEYHRKFKPHLCADLIVELPESGHSISRGEFSREMCFDPKEAEVF